jgi:predicted DNA-binding transcriptional regulator YafY
MQASADGLTLDQIGERFGVDRRTATRMRDAVAALFPGAESFRGDDGKNHWRLPNGAARALVQFDAEELAALQTPAHAARLEPDLELLVCAEGLAARPGPCPAVALRPVADLPHAILASRNSAAYRS